MFATLVIVLMLVAQGPVFAQDQAGRFDFWVLSLSWSPSFCEAADPGARSPQCNARPYAFVVHGLWPQDATGEMAPSLPNPAAAAAALDYGLDARYHARTGLIYHEWDEHGTCSGLSAPAYFQTVRKAREAVNIPSRLRDLQAPLAISPEEVAADFIKANPGLSAQSMWIDCDRKRLREVRICFNKELGFRSCPRSFPPNL